MAICAEIIAVHSGSAVPSLRDGTGPIHRPTIRPSPSGPFRPVSSGCQGLREDRLP